MFHFDFWQSSKRPINLTVKIMRFSILILCILVLQTCSGKPYVVEYNDSNQSSTSHIIAITNHGWHTGIVLSSQDAIEYMPFLFEQFGGAPFIEFGWGDRGFYQARDITAGLAVLALFWPTDTVVHVVAVNTNPAVYFATSDVIELKLTHSQMKSLRQFILISFFHDSTGRVVKTVEGIYGNSQFYKGEGSYYLFNTCNKWTAKGLKSAGLDISTYFKLSAGSVMDYLTDNCQDSPKECTRPQ